MCLVILICCVVDQSCSPVIQYNYYTTVCSTLRGRIEGAARSIISVLHTVGIYSTGGEFIALWVETDLRLTSTKRCLGTKFSDSSVPVGLQTSKSTFNSCNTELLCSWCWSRPHPSHNNSRFALATVL